MNKNKKQINFAHFIDKKEILDISHKENKNITIGVYIQIYEKSIGKQWNIIYRIKKNYIIYKNNKYLIIVFILVNYNNTNNI